MSNQLNSKPRWTNREKGNKRNKGNKRKKKKKARKPVLKFRNSANLYVKEGEGYGVIDVGLCSNTTVLEACEPALGRLPASDIYQTNSKHSWVAAAMMNMQDNRAGYRLHLKRAMWLRRDMALRAPWCFIGQKADEA